MCILEFTLLTGSFIQFCTLLAQVKVLHIVGGETRISAHSLITHIADFHHMRDKAYGRIPHMAETRHMWYKAWPYHVAKMPHLAYNVPATYF